MSLRVRRRRPPEALGPALLPLLLEPLFLLPPRDGRGNAGGRAPVPPLEPFPQAAKGHGLVPVLAPFVSAGDGHPCGEVDEADPALRAVLVLAPLAAGHEGLHPALGEELVVRPGDGERVGGGKFFGHTIKMGDFGGGVMAMAPSLQEGPGQPKLVRRATLFLSRRNSR